ncbi:unnamed protein product [Paramecium sonneborni]|uniref:Uncharacterized protein n=1 Tax=Paramecium sonneborni TaxID=65129 RepID=A0A8S1L5J8_9CILI|nr:unnamed protein product [Paramecium sonneborni]
MNTFHEYQLQVPVVKQLEKINESQNLEGSLALNNERLSLKQKKLEIRHITSNRLIPITNEKLPRLSQSKSPQQSVKLGRAITEYESSNKQSTIKPFFKTNFDNDSSNYTDDEKGKIKFKRDEKKLKTNIYKTGIFDNVQNKKFAEFVEQIEKIKKQLEALQKYLNNSRKVFLVVRNIVEKRKNLRKVLLKNGKDELVDLSEIEKFCSVKEFITINGEQKLIDKLNISLLDDIIYANEVLENLKIQNEILDMKKIADQVNFKINYDYNRKKLNKQVKQNFKNQLRRRIEIIFYFCCNVQIQFT